MRTRLSIAFTILAIALVPAFLWASELNNLLSVLLAPPKLSVAPGFSARMLVAPGELYDPFDISPKGNKIWVTDDGGAVGLKGGRLLSIDRRGKITVLIPMAKFPPIVGFDIAPANFGKYGGQVFALVQPQVFNAGTMMPHQIWRMDPAHGFDGTKVCDLPKAGIAHGGVPAWGANTRFGPQGTPFAGRLFAITTMNQVIYQITPDLQCTVFTQTQAPLNGPVGMAFTPDGKTMLTTAMGPGGADKPGGAALVAFSPTGQTVKTTPLPDDVALPWGIGFAPKEWGAYAGEVFISDAGDYQIPVPTGETLKADGRLLRMDGDEKWHTVITGLINPTQMLFVGDRLYLGDVVGDWSAGLRELPDGFMIEVRPAGRG